MTEAHSGATFSLRLGGSTSLRLSRGPLWGPPTIEGGALVSERQSYESDPGFTEYILRAVEGGRSIVRVGGEPGCEQRNACPAHDVVLTFVVS